MNYVFGNQECSSGCESGWTLYLEHSSISPDASFDRQKDSPHRRRNRVFTDAKRSNDDDDDEEDEEDEDLSMVSDASSGPPHLHEEEGFYHYTITSEEPSCRNNLTRKKKSRENRCPNKVQDHSSLLDDTASSPFLDLSSKTRSQPSVENVLEYSQGYSTTQFEGRPPYQQHYDFFQSGNQLQQQNQWFEGKRW